MNDKNEILDKIWSELKKTMEQQHISQAELCRRSKEQGYIVGQPEISKLFTGKQHLTLYQLIAFSKVLHVSIDQLVGLQKEESGIKFENGSFVTDPNHDAFEGYLGCYNTVFHSTSPFEERLLFGKLNLRPSIEKRVCEADFRLNTGECDGKGQPIIKHYHGQMIISIKQAVAYIFLFNEKIGDISIMEMRFRNFFVQNIQCRLGLVLTAGSGEVKGPVLQKIFLSRDTVKEASLKYVRSMLQLRDNDVYISEERFKELVSMGSITGFDFSKLKDNVKTQSMLCIDESDIRRVDRKIKRSDLAMIYSEIRAMAENDYLIHLTEMEDSKVYEIYRRQSNE